jgi:FMN phosphatase YigB (HAD superfamily)
MARVYLKKYESPVILKAEMPSKLSIFFDIIGPLIDEEKRFQSICEIARVVTTSKPVLITDEVIERALRKVLDARPPSITKSAIFEIFSELETEEKEFLCKEIKDILNGPRHCDLVFTDGVENIITRLSEQYNLVIAGNPSNIKAKLESADLLRHFNHRSMNLKYDFSKKTKTEFLLEICRKLNLNACECVMVGNRIDNDITPAKAAGFGTIWVKCGFLKDVHPLVTNDRPDKTIDRIADLPAALEELTLTWPNRL